MEGLWPRPIRPSRNAQSRKYETLEGSNLKTVLMTGADSGFGLEVAMRLAEKRSEGDLKIFGWR